MSYIDRNLLEGEQVVYRTRLHWLLFIGPVIFTVVILLPIAWFLYNGPWSNFTWIPLVLGLLVLLATFIKRQSSDFAVTKARNDESWRVQYAFGRTSTQQDRSHCREPKFHRTDLWLWKWSAVI